MTERDNISGVENRSNFACNEKTDSGNLTDLLTFSATKPFYFCYFCRLLLERKRWLNFQIPFAPQITYSLLSDSSGDHHLFRIDPKLGIIYTEAVFDREARSSYLLEVQSEDGEESARPGKNKQPNSGQE